MAIKKKTASGAKFIRRLSEEELNELCCQRGTTDNNYSPLSHADVIKAAKQIGKASRDSFNRWMNGGSTTK